MKTANCNIAVLPHEKWHTWGMTGQGVPADKTIGTFFSNHCTACHGLFDLNWTFGFFSLSGDRGALTEEWGCTNIWMTPSEKRRLRCTSGYSKCLREKNRKWTGISCPVSSMTLHCVGTMWRVNCFLANRKISKTWYLAHEEPAMSLQCLLLDRTWCCVFNKSNHFVSTARRIEM